MGGIRLTLAPLAISIAGAFGTYMLYTALAFGWTGLGIGPRPSGRRGPAFTSRLRTWLAQAGLADVPLRQFAAVMAGFFLVATMLTYALFGGMVVAVVTGTFAATSPVAAYRARRERRQAMARESWPRMIEEIRLLTGSVGRSVPQALLDVGRHGPEGLRPAFRAAEREWLISTDFSRTVAVLKTRLADPTADMTCETLLVAHEMGGHDLERRLAALAEDRIQDVQGRKDARAKQSGVRFARRFVLIVPLGMALAGLSIGPGREAYRTSGGQFAVLLGVASIAGCWLWGGRLLRLPDEERVFDA